ncbi:MAG: malate dehydrogenase [Candidatus Omnitrophota bacterium]|nr:MAG: malate dehydrogenase [Candidatus Omnitrophota bacterium]
MAKKISVIGSGAVGSTLAFSLLCRLQLEELVLVDITEGLAKGNALDLEDTRGVLGFNTKIIGTQDYDYIKDSTIVIVTAGIARKEGMSRLDLLKTNAKVARQASSKIKELCPSAIVIVVTNPLDLITYIITKETGFSRNKVLGMGASLDTSRLLNILSQETNTQIPYLKGYIWGMHSKDMIVSGWRIKVKGNSLEEALGKEAAESFAQRVKLRGAEIVGYLKNRSAHFAPALACCALIEAIAHDKNEIIPVSILLQGEYGLKNVCMAVPCVINRRGAEKIIEEKLNLQEKKQLQKVKEVFKECTTLL